MRLREASATSHIGAFSDGPVLSAAVISDDVLSGAGLRALLHESGHIHVTATLDYGADSPKVIRRRPPTLIILELSECLHDALLQLLPFEQFIPECKLIALGPRDDVLFAQELVNRGVSGYLLRSVRHQHLLAAVQAIGEIPGATMVVLAEHSPSPAPREVLRRPNSILTLREQEVIRLAAQACTNLQIAHRLGISEGTVKRHMSTIFTKLHAVSRVDAINKYAHALS